MSLQFYGYSFYAFMHFVFFGGDFQTLCDGRDHHREALYANECVR